MPTNEERKNMKGSKVKELPPLGSKKYEWYKLVAMRKSFVPYNPLAQEEDYYLTTKMSGPYRNRNKI